MDTLFFGIIYFFCIFIIFIFSPLQKYIKENSKIAYENNINISIEKYTLKFKLLYSFIFIVISISYLYTNNIIKIDTLEQNEERLETFLKNSEIIKNNKVYKDLVNKNLQPIINDSQVVFHSFLELISKTKK